MATLFSLVVGYFLMLPDAYKMLSESTVASCFFGNNIFQAITAKSYWDTSNLYKPLMHLWYVGVLMQAYILIPLALMLVVRRFRINMEKGFKVVVISLTLISFFLFLLPSFNAVSKFYHLPFRLFEIASGGLIVLWKPSLLQKKNFFWGGAFCCFIIDLFYFF